MPHFWFLSTKEGFLKIYLKMSVALSGFWPLTHEIIMGINL